MSPESKAVAVSCLRWSVSELRVSSDGTSTAEKPHSLWSPSAEVTMGGIVLGISLGEGPCGN